MKSKLLQVRCNTYRGIIDDFDKNLFASCGLDGEKIFSKFLLQLNQNKSGKTFPIFLFE